MNKLSPKINKLSLDWWLWAFISFLLILFKFSFHELWKDEWQAYFVSRDMSITSMLSFLHYEGHPALWYIYLKIFSIFEGSIREDLLIQFSHVLLGVITSYLLIIKIRLPLIVKLLFTLSYFLFFEYGIVNRGYIMLALLSFYITYLIQQGNVKNWKLYVSIFLLCQVEVYGVLMGFSFLIYLLFNEYLSIGFLKIKSNLNITLSLFIGTIVLILTIFPRGNEDDFSRAYIGEDLSINNFINSFQGNIANVFAPGLISDTSANGYTTMGIMLSLIFSFLIYLLLKDKKSSLVGMFVFILEMFLFHSLIFEGGIRQWGIVYIMFICMVALRFSSEDISKRNYLLILLLAIIPIIHNVRGLIKDYTLPFTNAQELGFFLNDKVPEKVPIIGINKFETTPVIGYTGRSFFEMNKGEPYTYFKWLEKVYIPTEDEFDLFAKYKNVGGVVIVSPKELDVNRFPNTQLWKAFNQPSFKNENYYLYTYAIKK